ncbi:MAG: hypothetical protein ABSG74_00625 [Candidatus Bathyarchaeia archaeon]|jgi:hypothetical protein
MVHTRNPVSLSLCRQKAAYIYYGKATEEYRHALGVITVKRAVVGPIIVCALLLWAVCPVFLGSPEQVLALAVNPSTNSDCPTESACFTLEFQNRGPWPIAIDIVDLQFYPSLIGPSVSINWLGPEPERNLQLMPFSGHTYIFWIKIMGGFGPPDKVYAILTANVTVLYVPHYVVLHSGKR